MKKIKYNTYSIILPTYNEAGHIEQLIIDIYNIFSKRKIDFEIITVDDGSTDGTIEKIINLKSKIKILKLITRINKPNSLVKSINEGINLSKFKNIIWFDADYSHPPKYLVQMIKMKEIKDYDLIFFSRFLNKSKRYFDINKNKPKIIDRLSIYLNKICNYFLFEDLHDYTSGYVLIKKDFFINNKLKGYYGDYFITLLVEAKINNLKILELPFNELDRRSGSSKTTGNKINLIIKCFFYLMSIISNFIRKLNFFKSQSIK